jgi:hypothetical protein
MASETGTTGKNAYISFGGTVLSTNFRTFSSDNTMATVDQSAGSDTGITRLTTLEDSTFSIEVKRPAAGTTNWIGLQVGAQGTLEHGPEGTATGKPKETAIAILTGFSTSTPYADLVIDTYSFEQDDNAGVTYTSY